MEARERATIDDTHTRFLEATERLFIERGYDGTKIRAIAKLSNSNLGVLSHYWGSKRKLFNEVFERRLRPLQIEREKRFDELERALARGKPVSIADVLRAQIEPAFLMPGADPSEAPRVRVLYGRALTDPSEEVVEAMAAIFRDSANQFFSLLKAVSPHIDQTEFFWRANCVAGAFSFSESFTERLTRFIDEDVSQTDWQAAADQVINFLAAGMAAAPAQNTSVRSKAKMRRA
ncbi:MAG TPA: TetR/AcrR family transcriptional regulator [Alphaproteobacteria bacterium]|nr:TetR/AcrR family transcriptional regulator [Alphaproteobacteria bacterium]